MRQSWTKFKNWVMSFTYQERRNKQLEIFRTKIEHYSSMDKDELNFEYFNCKAEYEHKKNILTLVNVWRYVLDNQPKGCAIAYDSKQKFIRYLLSKGFKYNDILELLEGGEYEFD